MPAAAFRALARVRLFLRWTLFLALAGCTGLISDQNGSVRQAQTCTGSGGGVPDPAPLRRLSVREFSATVQSLTGVDPTPFMAGFPSDFAIPSLFDVEVEQQQIDNSVSNAIRQVADNVSKQVIDPSRRMAFVGCDPTVAAQRDTCLRSFVAKFGRAIWRRPLSQEEADDMLALANSETDGWQSVAIVVYATLQTPSFVLRPEFGSGVAGSERPGLVKLAPHEIATRLSFTLFGQAPSQALLDAATLERLQTADGIRAVATEMLADPKADQLGDELIRQWFGLRVLASQTRTPAAYPLYSAGLLQSMEAAPSCAQDRA